MYLANKLSLAAVAPLLAGALLSIDIACRHGAQQQTRRSSVRRTNDETDGRTDGQTDRRMDRRPTVP